VIVHKLDDNAVKNFTTIDLATVQEEPESLIGRFGFNQCQCGVASFVGSPPWELHLEGDELLHILSGSCSLTIREEGTEESKILVKGDVAVIPKGCWHRTNAEKGVTMLYMTPQAGNEHSWGDPSDKTS
tara:strand:- start:1039 stop:1425 length:387 start_codon:yes stop_codon:yes gene_type:complete